MLLPIIDSFIKEVNTLAGDPNSPSFDEELSSCLFVMANETNPVDLGCKFFMLNISLSILRKILMYFTILKIRADSLRSPDGKPIDQEVLTLALKGMIYAIGREEEPLDNWRTISRDSQSSSTTTPTAMETSSGEENTTLEQNSRISSPSTAHQTILAGRSSRSSNSNRSCKNAVDTNKSRPGTSKQANAYSRQSSNRQESGNSAEPTISKQSSKGTTNQALGRKSRSASTSTSPVSPLSLLSPNPLAEFCSTSSKTHSTSLTMPIRTPVMHSIETLISEPSTSSSTLSSTFSSASVSSPSSSSSTTTPSSSEEPTFGLIVTFDVTVSIPIHQGFIRVLDPYRDKIETSPMCANHIFIKVKDKKDLYFLKRQIEILTRITPRIVVTKFFRFTLDVPKQLTPTIQEFVNHNAAILQGEYYVYSRLSTSNENSTIEILASVECEKSIKSASCQLKIGQETREAVPIGCYQECPRCFFCYDDVHECSPVALIEMEGLI